MKRKFDKLAVYFIGYVYAFVMVYLAASIIDRSTSVFILFAISAGAYLFVNLALSFKITRIVTASLLTLSAIATGILYLSGNAQFITNQANSIYEVCLKIYYSEVIDTPALKASTVVMIVLSAIAAAILVYLLFNRFFRFFLLTASVIAIQLFAWSVTYMENKIVFSVICLLTVISYFRHVYEKKLKSGLITDHKVSGSIMLFSVPAAIIPIIFIMMLPKNDLPIQWPWLDQKIMKAIQYIEQRFSYSNVEFFSLSTTGFNGFSERLGGPVKPSNTVVMDVKAEKRTYLRGAAYTWYENNQWAQIRNDRLNVVSPRENENELAETREGWLNIPVETLFPNAAPDDAELLKNLESGRFNTLLFPTYKIEVSYRNMTTRSMFIPLLTVMPVHDAAGSAMPVNENIHGIVIARDKLPSGSKYAVSYVQPMYGEPMLRQALTFSSGTLYRDALTELYKQRNQLIQADPSLSENNIVTEFSVDSLGNPITSQTVIRESGSDNAMALNMLDRRIQALEQLFEWSKEIENDYTKVSDTVPERVKTLALDLTKDSRNNYEKVLAIQKYLIGNYKYTLNASRVPQGRDFVDYFLFDDKKGYCTYYATAMTVLLRYNGIPARYVEGYVMPEDHNDNDVYTITNRMAHAWVEAYFQGFGWLTFEPTPVYDGIMDYMAMPENTTGVLAPQGPDIEELMRRFQNRTDIPGYIPEMDINTKGIDLSKYLKYLPLALGGLIVLMIFLNQMAALIGSLYVMRLKNKKKVLAYYQMMLKWLQKTGYAIKPGESVLEFGKRVDKYYYFDASTFLDVSEIFSKVRYGGMEVATDELIRIKKSAKQLRKAILKELGIRRYIPLRRIVLGI